MALTEIKFNLSTFSVQIHELPMRCDNGKRHENWGAISKSFTIEWATRTNIVGLKYIRMQVEMDVQKQILSGFRHVINYFILKIKCYIKKFVFTSFIFFIKIIL